MTALTERVADAIREAMREETSCARADICEHGECACCRDAARAALAAVRAALHDLPHEAVRAMATAFAEGAHPVRDAARAMADTMLKETE